MKSNPATIGLISDTHGQIRGEVLRAFAGVRLILHAGDVGDFNVIQQLEKVAPVIAVRGNCDRSGRAAGLPPTQVVEMAGTSIYLLHQLELLDLNPVAAGFQIVVSGHSHRFGVNFREGTLYVNPGGAGPCRFGLPVTAARLTLGEGKPKVRRILFLPTGIVNRDEIDY